MELVHDCMHALNTDIRRYVKMLMGEKIKKLTSTIPNICVHRGHYNGLYRSNLSTRSRYTAVCMIQLL